MKKATLTRISVPPVLRTFVGFAHRFPIAGPHINSKHRGGGRDEVGVRVLVNKDSYLQGWMPGGTQICLSC